MNLLAIDSFTRPIGMLRRAWATVCRGSARALGLASLSAALLASSPAIADSFDHSYADFDAFLKRHVAWDAKGVASTIDYAGALEERARLRKILDQWSAVTPAQYQGFTRDQRLAFLINVYNGFTIELILTKYPDLESIRDLGGLFSSPWKQRFFNLLGEPRHLDWVEHETIRAPGVFDEPRIHFAVNCASIGCPALMPDAFTAATLDAQLTEGTRRFLADRSRNRFDPASGKLLVSKIFDWYGDDFRKGHGGYTSLEGFFAAHAELLADDPAARARIAAADVRIDFLAYDWKLNDGKKGEAVAGARRTDAR